jgi:GT2 family glycosyltransferase
MKHHIHIKTFKKPAMLNALLKSLEQRGYIRDEVTVTVGDDNPGESLEVLSKFNFIDAYLTGNVNGIWANNNRGIRYFLEKTDADALTILDNDIQFTEGGLLEELEQAHRSDRQEHITGFVKGLDGIDGLQVVFPFIAESKYLKWHPGTHGCMLWQTRRMVEAVGYQLEYSYFYGAEHAEYTHRCLAAQRHSTLGLYPVLKNSARFFKLNPDDCRVYDFDISQVMATNQQKMQERDAQTISGLNLKEENHHLGEELIIRREDKISGEKIRELLLNKSRQHG